MVLRYLYPPAPGSDPTPAPGSVAPDFSLERATGGTFSLSQQWSQGPVALVFFQRCG